jgi:hypothetical protein
MVQNWFLFSVSLTFQGLSIRQRRRMKDVEVKLYGVNVEASGQHRVSIDCLPVKYNLYLFTRLLYDRLDPGLVICQFHWLHCIEWLNNCEWRI